MSKVNTMNNACWWLRTLSYCNIYRLQLYHLIVVKVTYNIQIMRYCTIVNALHLDLHSPWPDSRTVDQEADEEEGSANKQVS